MRRRRVFLAVFFALAPPSPALAQLVPAVDVGVVSLGYTGTARAAALSITPTLRYLGDRSLLSGSVTFSQFDGGEWSTQGAIAGSRFTPAWHVFRGEAAASGSLIAHRTLFRAGDALARARLHAHGDELGAWAGGGYGWGHHADSWHPQSVVEAGIWSEHGPLRISASITSRTVTVADSFPAQNGGAWARFDSRGSHRDAVASFGWISGRLELDVSAGTRDGGRLTGSSRWGSIAATYHLTEWLQVIGEAGGEPEIVAQRLPQGRFGLLAIRFSPRGAHMSASSVAVTRPMLTRDFVLGEDEPAGGTVRIHVPRARRVELRADFTDWETVMLRLGADGSWQLPVQLEPGVYRVSIRIDDGEWQAPPGVPAVQDEFGSLVGLIVVK